MFYDSSVFSPEILTFTLFMIMFRSSASLFCWLTVCLVIPHAPAQGGRDFGRYQVILDQQLLGRPEPVAPPVRPEAPPPAAPPSWSVEYRLTMITEDLFSDRARVGLYHVRNQIGYLLIEGEENEGFRLHSVNYETQSAEISYQGTRHHFSLESAPSVASSPEPQQSRSPQARNVRRVSRSVSTSEPAEPPEPPPEPRFSSPEELQAHLQNVQMDAIRTGKPPLPIPLTPEMDAQLVQEGILPPLEE